MAEITSKSATATIRSPAVDGDDVIVTGTGDNDIDGGNGNDERNGLIEQPTIDIDSGGDVIEGRNLEVVVWLDLPTDHDVTATLDCRKGIGPIKLGPIPVTDVPGYGRFA